MTVDKLVRNHGIPILPYVAPESTALSHLSLKPLHTVRELIPPPVASLPTTLDLVWHAGYYFQEDFGRIPSWSGFMQDVSTAATSHPVSDIRMLPIIDLNPNDMSCIFFTLNFLEKQAQV